MPAPETLSLGQLLDKQLPKEQWIIGDGLLPVGGLLIVAGQPKARKSFTLNALCYAMATATPAFSAHRVKAGGRIESVFSVDRSRRVLIFEQELGQAGYRERWEAVLAAEGPYNQQLLRNNLFIRSMDFTLLLDGPGIDAIGAEIQEISPDVVCFDPLAKFHQSEENSAMEMGRVMRGLSVLRAKYGVAAIVLHHEAKPSEHRKGGAAGRGSSVVFADCDAWMSQKLINRSAGIISARFELRRAPELRPATLRQDERQLFVLDKWGNSDEP